MQILLPSPPTPYCIRFSYLSACLCLQVASTITYPHEVLRSYMHVTGSGPIDGFKDAVRYVWKEDGFRGFYRGCGTNLCRTTPAAALTFTSFELIARGLRQLAQQGRDEE